MRAILSFILKSTTIEAVIEALFKFDKNSKEVIEPAKDRVG